MAWEKQLDIINNLYPSFLSVNFPDRYELIKEIFHILDELSRTDSLNRFQNLYKHTLSELESMNQEIQQYIINLPNYCVNERCYWEKQLAMLRKIRSYNTHLSTQKNHFEDIINHLDNIRDIQLNHGNPLWALEADLDIVEECMRSLRTTNDRTLHSYLKMTFSHHLTRASDDISPYRTNPEAIENFIRLGRYYLFENEYSKAKYYFDIFNESKLSIGHYAPWIRKYYHELLTEFSKK
ncbi:MAG: hypothetical protein K9N11_06820 [Lentisphaeria bacterium]|nr:hypothetical protein [Candidatus Neomarinimicrobiota bacterium]MCF7842548.1 hypothetical protein [Lentisphaeria bacterium]